MGPKRAAFADVSNTARLPLAAKDDSVVATKAFQHSSTKDVAFIEPASKPATLLRPAQRPMSLSGIKGLLNNITTSVSSNVLRSNSSDDRIEPIPAQANTKRLMPKKATTVFQESSVISADQNVNHAAINLPPQVTAPSTALLENANHNHLPPLSFTSYPDDQAAASHALPAGDWQHLAGRVRAPSQLGIREPPVRIAKAFTEYAPVERRSSASEPETYVDAPTYNRPDYPSVAVDSRPKVSLESQMHLAPLPGSEVVEYWEEEGYDDQYEDGYLTAKSVKSKGDYTTGATTVVVAPKVTALVERELAAARHIVQNSAAAGDIEEDESWDTSMVAEYGDEIFDYMRVLEVGDV